MPDLKLTEREVAQWEHNYQDNIRALLCADWRALKAQVSALTAERDAARLALAEVKRHWWPAFDKMSQATKDEMEKAMWLVRDGDLAAAKDK